MPSGVIGSGVISAEERDALLEWLSDGKTMADYLRQPHITLKRSQYYHNIRADEELYSAFKLAREIGADAIAEQVRLMTYAEPERVTDQNGITRIDPAYVALVKMRGELDLKLLAKWNSNKYGDRVTTEHVGAEGGPIKIEGVTVTLVRPDAG